MTRKSAKSKITFNQLSGIIAFLASLASIITLILYIPEQNQANNVQATEIAKLDQRFSVQSTASAIELANQRHQIKLQDSQIAIAETQIAQNDRLHKVTVEEATVTAKQLSASQQLLATPIADRKSDATATAISIVFSATREALETERKQIFATQTAIASANVSVLNSGTYRVEAGGYESTWTLEISEGEIKGTSEWPCCPGHRVDEIVGSISGNKVYIERDCSGQGWTAVCLQNYVGTIFEDTIIGQFTGSQSGTWTLYIR